MLNVGETRPPATTPDPVSIEAIRARYIDLLEGVLTGILIEDDGIVSWEERDRPRQFDRRRRVEGMDWPTRALTMIGLKRLRHLGQLVTQAIKDEVRGDFIETGVWRGGACIYMRALLAVHGIRDRKVWVADSFEGLPPPNAEKYPADAQSLFHLVNSFAPSIDEVKANFAKHNLLDEQVVFLQGWFRDTLPTVPIERLAILRLDGDMYESTMDALENLYSKLSPGGFVIIDDYQIPNCRKAVKDFRARHAIADPLQRLDWASAWWRKSGPAANASATVPALEHAQG